MKEWTEQDTFVYLGNPPGPPAPASEFFGFFAALLQIFWCIFPASLDGGFPTPWNRQVYGSLCMMLPSMAAWLFATHACYVSRGRRSSTTLGTLSLVIFYATVVGVLKLNTFYRWF